MRSSVISSDAAVGVVEDRVVLQQGANHRQSVDNRPETEPTADPQRSGHPRRISADQIAPESGDGVTRQSVGRLVTRHGRVRSEEHGDTAVAVVEVGSEDDEL